MYTVNGMAQGPSNQIFVALNFEYVGTLPLDSVPMFITNEKHVCIESRFDVICQLP